MKRSGVKGATAHIADFAARRQLDEMDQPDAAIVRTAVPRRAGLIPLALAALLLPAFFLIAEGVRDGRVLTGWDAANKDHWQQHARANPPLRYFSLGLTQLGNIRVLSVASGTLLALLLVRRRWRPAILWTLATFGGFMLVHMMKDVYDRPRPVFAEPLVHEVSRSFPSGHAANSMLFYGTLVYLASRWRRTLAWRMLPFVCLLIAGICLTRVYLGAHWTSDVIGGAVLGGGWCAAVIGLSGWRNPDPECKPDAERAAAADSQ